MFEDVVGPAQQAAHIGADLEVVLADRTRAQHRVIADDVAHFQVWQFRALRDLVDGLIRQRADFVLDIQQHGNQDGALGRVVRDHRGEALFELVGKFHVRSAYPGLTPWPKFVSPFGLSSPRCANSCHAWLKSNAENLCRPYGTRVRFPLYPALRLRLRAGLNYAAPTALDSRLAKSTGKYQSLL